jgi:catalase
LAIAELCQVLSPFDHLRVSLLGVVRDRPVDGHAFRGGQGRFVRYSWRPEPGTARIYLDEEQHIPSDYLQLELRERLAVGPVRFTLHLKIAEKDDNVTDPATAWPQERYSVHAGTLELTGLLSDQIGGCEALIFDPGRVTDGIEPSDAPILKARPGAYSVSFQRRTSS